MNFVILFMLLGIFLMLLAIGKGVDIIIEELKKSNKSRNIYENKKGFP